MAMAVALNRTKQTLSRCLMEKNMITSIQWRRASLAALGIFCGVGAAGSAWSQTVTITNVQPSPLEPGGTATVTIYAGYTENNLGTLPSGCNMTMIPYSQGNVPSPIGSIPILFDGNTAIKSGPGLLGGGVTVAASVTIPAGTALGNYALEVNCGFANLPNQNGASQLGNYVWAEKDVTVGGPPKVTWFSPATAAMGQTVTLGGEYFGTRGYVILAGKDLMQNPLPNVYITGNAITEWSSNTISFTIPETAPVGTYEFEVQSGDNGASPVTGFLGSGPNVSGVTGFVGANLQIVPLFPGWADLHTHPMSYLGFGGKLIYGGVDQGSWLPPEHASAAALENAINAGTVTLSAVLSVLGGVFWES